MTDLSALLEGLRATTGGDRELDTDLFFEIAWGGQGDERIPPAYTSDLTAALALVQTKLPGWNWQAADYHEAGAWGAVWRTTERVWSAEAATPALSILCALLIALIAEQTS